MNDLIERLASLEADVNNLKEWQKKQNGYLQRLEAKIDRIYVWLIGLMGSVIASLFLLIMQFFVGR